MRAYRPSKVDETTPRRSIKLDAFWDIEAQNWNEFVVGGLMLADGTYEEFDYRREDEFALRLLEIEGTVWAHAGGIYDLKWMIDRLAPLRYSMQLVTAGSRIVSVQIGKTLFCDSYALAPMPLSEFTSGMGVTKDKLDLPCVCAKKCGGYCSIRRDMPRAHWSRVKQYLHRDCGSLKNSLEALSDFGEENDLDLGRTIGSSAWRNVQRMLGIPDAALGEQNYRFARRAYFGGRVQLYRTGIIHAGHEWDVNSMYPWTLSTFAMPTGRVHKQFGRGAARAYSKSIPGIYSAKVVVPQSHIPPLPIRYDNETSVAYPVGAFHGSWTLPELQHAESVGVSVEPTEALLWDASHVLFRDWVNKIWGLRDKAPGGKKSPLGTFCKFYANSLTGKFGSNPEREQWVVNPGTVRGCICPCERCKRPRKRCQCKALPLRTGKCNCRAHRQVSDYIWSSSYWAPDTCSHVQWAAYLTSHARVELNTFQLSDDKDGRTMVYSDTDSCHATELRSRRLGKELGQWAYEGPWAEFKGIAPKVYSFKCLPGCTRHKRKDDPNWKCPGGKLSARAKGVPMEKTDDGSAESRPIVWSPDSPETGIYRKDGIVGFKAGAKLGKLFSKRQLARRLNDGRWVTTADGRTLHFYGDRISTDDGFTRAPDVSELKP